MGHNGLNAMTNSSETEAELALHALLFLTSVPTFWFAPISHSAPDVLSAVQLDFSSVSMHRKGDGFIGGPSFDG